MASYKFDEKIGEIQIQGVLLEVRSNTGFENKPSHHNEYDHDGNFLGVKNHCVALVRKFLYLYTGRNYAKVWSTGHAQNWWENAGIMAADKICRTNCRKTHCKKSVFAKGDIICFTGGKHGHVAIVSKTFSDKDTVGITQQNFFGDKRDLSTILDLTQSVLKKDNGETYTIQGGLRFKLL